MTNWGIRLAQADREVSKTERVIEHQRALIARLEGDTKADADNILGLMNNILADFSRHRELLRRSAAATA